MTRRTLKTQHAALRDDIGDLVTRRPVPHPGLDQIDPFLFLNHHGPQTYPPGNAGLPFGPHPHRGFETVTFILDGDLTHLDSGGHASVIGAGGVQWMTAGRGLIHAELSSDAFKRTGGGLEILQLWVNLPARLKLTEPGYVGLQKAQIPALSSADGLVTANLVSGSWNGETGPIRSLTDVHLMTVRLAPGAEAALPAPACRNVLLYVVSGAVTVASEAVPAHRLVELNPDGDEVAVTAQEASVLLYGHARPCGEPVVSYGPFVMNTREEIGEAIRDYQAGKFGPPL